jgi:hypothetical protein
MRTSLAFCCLLAVLSTRPAAAQVDAPGPASRDPAALVLLGPAQDAQFAPLRAADDERVAAIIAADPARLDAILSEDLHYAHSNGVTETKAAFIESLTSRRAIYKSFEYTRHRFIPAGPGVVLMTGRALVRIGNAEGERLLDLNFLAVWREEGGRWRFLAWQSNRNPPTEK